MDPYTKRIEVLTTKLLDERHIDASKLLVRAAMALTGEVPAGTRSHLSSREKGMLHHHTTRAAGGEQTSHSDVARQARIDAQHQTDDVIAAAFDESPMLRARCETLARERDEALAELNSLKKIRSKK